MKTIYLFILFLLSGFSSFSQISFRTGAVQHVEVINWKETTLINKKTGEEMSEKDFSDLIKQYPKLALERSIDKFGVTNKMYYDPDNLKTDGRRYRNPELQPKVGEIFPEFVFKTLSNKTFESDKLTNDFILVAFDFFPEMSSFKTLNDKLKPYKNVNSFLCFSSDDMITENTAFTEFEIVNFNTVKFLEKYNIVTPVAFLLDKNRKVLAKISGENLEELDKYLKN
jgi:hypothetical protein